jgi:Uma2 family endonuclease
METATAELTDRRTERGDVPSPDPQPEIVSAVSAPGDDGVRIRPITVDEYHRMLEVGILYEREPVELLDGQLIAMPQEGPLHAGTASAIVELFVLRFAGRAAVRAGNPLTLPPISEPQPDVALVRRRESAYLDAHPGSEDVFLTVEISRTTLRYDRGRKLGVYAKAGIPEVWIIDLVHRQVEIFRDPAGDTYASARVASNDEAIAPRAFPDDAIPVTTLLP